MVRNVATAVALLAVVASFAVVAVRTPAAQAAVTTMSEFSKTGTNQTHPSTATLGSPGTANPGDTIKWVLDYRNSTGRDASVRITDPITGGQTYVANSLKLPPNLTGSVSGGTLTATGTMTSGTTMAQVPMSTPVAIDFRTPGGDGYSVENFGTNVYTVYHHNASRTVVFCATVANTRCPNWPAGQFASYVSPVAGTPIGTGPTPAVVTAHNNGSFIENGRLYWGAQITTATAGRYPVGVMCLDLTTTPAVSCGFTQLDTVPTAAPGAAMIATNALAASDGNYYFFDRNGNMLCFDPGVGACGSVNVTGGATTTSALTSMLTHGNYVYASFNGSVTTPTGTVTRALLACYDVAAGASCSGAYPIDQGAVINATYPDTLAPVLDPQTGALVAACDLAKRACYTPSGSTVPNPYPTTMTGIGYPNSSVGYGDGLIVGTKFYASPRNNLIGCWDFAQAGSGLVPSCAGYTPRTNSLNYTVRALTGDLEGCAAADGDAGQITIFNLSSGGGCNAVQAVSVKVTPSAYYCDGQSGHASSWGAVTLAGLSAQDYVGARLTLTDVNDNEVPGWVDVPFPATGAQSLDISSIPVAGTTASLTAHVTIVGSTNPAAMTSAQLTLSWRGDAVQICYETKTSAVACLSSSTVSNTATAVTTAGSATDGPTGNSSGAVSFTVSNTDAACLLRLAKTATPNPALPGDTVTYTITVANTGTSAYSTANPATFTDDISSVLLDAAYNEGSLTSSAGTPSYDAATHVISWAGPLAAGASATITYTVVVDDPDTGRHSMANRVVTPPGTPSNCAAASVDPACAVTVPVKSFRVVKDTPATVVLPGSVVPYTITVTNTGQVDYTAAAPASFTDDLSSVLDDATYGGDASATDGTLDYTAPVLSWSGALAVGATVTITYSVTVDSPDTGNAQLSNTVVTPDGSGGNCATESTDPACQVDVPEQSFSVDKSAAVQVADLGQKIVYTLIIRNTGATAYTEAAPASLVDDLTGVLDDATYDDDANASDGTVSYDSPNLSWSGPLDVGATVTLTYSVTVNDPDRADHLLDNTVTNPLGSGGSCVPGSTDPGCRSVVPVRSYTVAKQAGSGATVEPGTPVEYVITVTNTGAADYTSAEPASFTDDLAAVLDDAEYEGDVTATSGTASYAEPILSWEGALPAGGTATIRYTVMVDDPYVGDGLLRNAALPDGPGGRCADDVTTTQCEPVDVRIVPPQLSIAKDDSKTILRPGDLTVYVLTVRNAEGAAAANNILIEDRLPAGLTFIDASDDGSYDPSTRTVSWTLAQLPAGAETTLTVTAGVDADVPADIEIRNTAAIAVPPSYCVDGDCDAEDVDRTPVPVSIAKDDGETVVGAGQEITYTLTASNAATVTDATGVVVTDTLPAELVFVSASDAGSYDDATRIVTWHLVALPAGGQRVLTVTATVSQDVAAGASLTNTATITTDQGCFDQAACTATDIDHTPDVAITKDDGRTVVGAGERLEYEITAVNRSAWEATGTVVSDALPAQLLFVAASDDGAYDAANHSVTWSLGTLAPGATRTLHVTATVADDVAAGATLTNRATITVDGGCIGAACAAADVDHTPDVSIVKDDGASAVAPGDSLTYAVTATNNAAWAATGVTITDELPVQLTFVSASDGGHYDATTRTVTWSLGDLAGGDIRTVHIVATVNAGLPDGTEVQNTAAVTTDQGCLGSGCESTDTDVVDVVAAGLAKTGAVIDTVSGWLAASALVVGLALLLTRRRRTSFRK